MQSSLFRVALLGFAGILIGSCASSRLEISDSGIGCHRIVLDPSPPWTASATWSTDESQLILVDPGEEKLAMYGGDGKRSKSVSLGGVGLDFSEPMRFERSPRGGYLVISKNRVLELGDQLQLQRQVAPFDGLQGLETGSLNDIVLNKRSLVGYADFIDQSRPSLDDQQTSGLWRRGFVRITPDKDELEMLFELPLDSRDGEYASYYLYDRRPYIAQLGTRVFVLRFTEPWSVHRVRRKKLEQIAVAPASDRDAGNRAYALLAWNEHLYVLTSQVLPDQSSVSKTEQRKMELAQLAERNTSLELQQALPVVATGQRRWTLVELDPRGNIGRRLVLPTNAERLRLLPGGRAWAAIEETTAPNLDGSANATTLLFLPSREISTADFSCKEAS